MKKLKLLFALAVLIILAGSVSAQQSTAPTVTFNIPVQFNNLHQSVTGVKITCSVSDGTSIVGEGTFTISPIPSDGNINQTETVTATQFPGSDITKAISYTVHFGIYVGNEFLHPSLGAARIEARVKEGTPFTSNVSGSIHW